MDYRRKIDRRDSLMRVATILIGIALNCALAFAATRLRFPLYPLFCGNYVFGMLVCGADGRLFEIGEFLTFQLSRSIFMNWVGPSQSCH